MKTTAVAAVAAEPCALCGAMDGEPVLEVSVERLGASQTFRLLRCSSCNLVRTEPRLAGEELERHYREEYWGPIRGEDLNWVRRDQRHRTAFLHRFRTEGSVLDVGCGLGLFLRALDPARWDSHGVEPMPVPYQEAARWLGTDRISPRELIAAGLPSARFDAVTFWDALEHLPNPRAALKEAFRVLRPGGLVLLTLPNFESYQARRFRQDWYALSLPHHFFHFTPATLTRLLEASGFRVRALENREGPENYHALKHSLLNRMTRLHGPRGGRLRYYLMKPFLRPWEWISTRLGGGAYLQVCAERLPGKPA